MRSNCIIWALWTYAARLRAWIRDGMPEQREPYLMVRPSRFRPRWVPHVLVAQWDSTFGLRVHSYKPINGREVPWYLAWTRLLFRGREEEGDWPDTVAEL